VITAILLQKGGSYNFFTEQERDEMDMDFVSRPAIPLVGMSFYGDPFKDAGDWSANNEIGRLSQRFMDFKVKNRTALKPLLTDEDFYEVHIYNLETESKGFIEVFVGQQINAIKDFPLELSCKILPAGQFAQIHLKGETIISDWYKDLDHDLARSGWQRGSSFFFQVYDQRYKGLDRIAESELTAYIPVQPLPK
jgi:predicted transcriptional regulator YdeE